MVKHVIERTFNDMLVVNTTGSGEHFHISDSQDRQNSILFTRRSDADLADTVFFRNAKVQIIVEYDDENEFKPMRNNDANTRTRSSG